MAMLTNNNSSLCSKIQERLAQGTLKCTISLERCQEVYLGAPYLPRLKIRAVANCCTGYLRTSHCRSHHKIQACSQAGCLTLAA